MLYSTRRHSIPHSSSLFKLLSSLSKISNAITLDSKQADNGFNS